MDQIIVEGVRCLRSFRTVPLKPITLLVGENSTGKSTFLALVRMAWEVCQGRPIDFNEEPFLLGGYDEIASFRGGRSGRVKTFKIGARVTMEQRRRGSTPPVRILETAEITATFASGGALPRITQWELKAGDQGVEVTFGGEDTVERAVLLSPSGRRNLKCDASFPVSTGSIWDRLLFLRYLQDEGGDRGNNASEVVNLFFDLHHVINRSLGPLPYAFAPIRTRPKRTYDPMRDVPEPEGSHVPMTLAQAFSSHPKSWVDLREACTRFGKASGLFSDVEVKRMGNRESGPFQLRVKISGPPRNILDVGYGVSQVLPIIIDSLHEDAGGTFLLQQPEVHLHPRAQAELGSFLCSLVKGQRKRFIIETHSDHLVDRVRMEVREGGRLNPEDVLILYFERANGEVKIHHLSLDSAGNITNAPPG